LIPRNDTEILVSECLKLDNIDLDLPPEKLQNEVLNLQNKLKTIQSKGLPLYSNQGATQELWERFYEKLN